MREKKILTMTWLGKLEQRGWLLNPGFVEIIILKRIATEKVGVL